MEGRTLKELRLRRRLSVDTIARAVGVHPDTLRAIECGDLVGDVALCDEIEDAVLTIRRRPAIETAKVWRRDNSTWLALYLTAVAAGGALGAIAAMVLRP